MIVIAAYPTATDPKRRKPSTGVRFHHRPTVAVVEARPELAEVSMAARVRDVLGGGA